MPQGFWSGPDESQALRPKPINVCFVFAMAYEYPTREESLSLLQWSPVHVPHKAASKRGKAGTLRVLFFPWDEGISLELLSYLPVSWMQHKSLVVEEVLAQAALPWLWSWFRVFSQAGISCSNSGATSMLGEQIQLTRDELMSF